MQINVSIVTYCNEIQQIENIASDILNSANILLNKIYIIDCFLVNINSTTKVLPKEIEFLVMTCHPN